MGAERGRKGKCKGKEIGIKYFVMCPPCISNVLISDRRLGSVICGVYVPAALGTRMGVAGWEEVVDAMMAVITKPEYPGGTVLEITCGSTRKIELVNDPGPVAGTGATITNVALPRAEMLGLLSTEYGK